jgi:hypothetical protein
MIVIPMAGRSSRFYQAGYKVPKYELPVPGGTLFGMCVRSFEPYFASERFLFVCRPGVGAEQFVQAECERLAIRDFECVTLEQETRGQAETVLLGMERSGTAGAEPLLIFNIDTVRPGYRFPAECRGSDGYLEVFRGEGDHWSFVRPVAPGSIRVAETSEKKRISDLCCTGLYQFARAADFDRLCRAAIEDIDNFCALWRELYVAPLYNEFIAQGADVAYHEVPRNAVLFSGTPSEYDELLELLARSDV